MRSLKIPSFSEEEILATCLGAISDPDLHRRLNDIKNNLNDAASDYRNKASNHNLHQVLRVDNVGLVTKDELVDLYSEHLSSSNGAARSVYNYIRNSAPNKKCPLCSVGTVAVLDHHLPKKRYPNLSILAQNLVPACHFCNDTKKARYPRCAEEQTLHPYYDEKLISSNWVKASIIAGDPLVILFSANPPENWSDVEKKRVKRHFSVCGLSTTFASNASDELSTIKKRVKRLFRRGGKSAVKNHLLEEVSDHIDRPNTWKLAMYQELSSNEWFLDGGFECIS